MKTKRKMLTSFTALLLLLIFSVSTLVCVHATAQNNGNVPPDMPQNAQQVDRSDITPYCKMESVQAMNTTVFFYQNVTMMMNCTQNCEMNVTIDEQVQNRILAIDVQPNRTMTLAMNMTAEAPEGVATMERTLNFYMGLETGEPVELQSQLKLMINQTELEQELGRELNMSALTWLYWNQTQNQWEIVESTMNQDGYLVCNTDHYSIWTVAEVENPEDIPETIHVLTIVALAAVAMVVAASLKRNKNSK
ncbi:MAG: hypothetical protein NWF03_00905 [Candidatus Bathyarchaeota archaeon]|nr:hypothetical protein [Candidatus Bathyarchaeota archaeon]